MALEVSLRIFPSSMLLRGAVFVYACVALYDEFVHSNLGVESETKAETETETETKTETQTNIETEPNIETEAKTETQTSIETEAKTETQTNIETEKLLEPLPIDGQDFWRDIVSDKEFDILWSIKESEYPFRLAHAQYLTSYDFDPFNYDINAQIVRGEIEMQDIVDSVKRNVQRLFDEMEEEEYYARIIWFRVELALPKWSCKQGTWESENSKEYENGCIGLFIHLFIYCNALE